MDFDEQPDAQQVTDHKELVDAFGRVLGTNDGKAVLFWVLETAGIYRDGFTGDDAATNYALGQKSTGLRLIDMLNQVSPRAYPRLLLDVADMKEMALAAKVENDPDDVA